MQILFFGVPYGKRTLRRDQYLDPRRSAWIWSEIQSKEAWKVAYWQRRKDAQPGTADREEYDRACDGITKNDARNIWEPTQGSGARYPLQLPPPTNNANGTSAPNGSNGGGSASGNNGYP